ncbi:MAG: hypothetical protein FJW95_09580 [Actinobacteria bacterium]|nr:hypothetical protein [Actinomycetota bacterium]
MAGVAFVVAAAFAFVLFVTLADLVMVQFTRNAARAAVDEGVRAGSRSDTPVATCETRARAVLDGLLGPGARGGVTVSCATATAPDAVRATVRVAVTPWLPGLPTWSFTIGGAGVREVLP